MTREETSKILMMVQALYPNFSVQNKTVTLNAWQMILGDYEFETVQKALVIYAKTEENGFAPTTGQIIKSINKMSDVNNISEMQAWDMVRNALSNSTYNSEQEFEKLPESVKSAVGSSENLRHWGQIEEKSLETVVQSNFIKAYRTIIANRKEKHKICGIATNEQKMIGGG